MTIDAPDQPPHDALHDPPDTILTTPYDPDDFHDLPDDPDDDDDDRRRRRRRRRRPTTTTTILTTPELPRPNPNDLIQYPAKELEADVLAPTTPRKYDRSVNMSKHNIAI